MSRKPKTSPHSSAAQPARTFAPARSAKKAAPVVKVPIVEPVIEAVAAEPMTPEAAIPEIAVQAAAPEVVETAPGVIDPVAEPDPIPEPEHIVEAAAEPAAEPAIEPIPAEPAPVAAVETASLEAAAEPIPPAIVDTALPPPMTKPAKLNPIQGMKTMIKTTEDLIAFNQANIDAFVKSGQIWTAGVQELTKQFATTAKSSYEESISTFKTLTSLKSFKDVVELQSSFAKTAFEKAVAEGNKLTDASIKLTEETLAPITARVTVAVETFGKAA